MVENYKENSVNSDEIDLSKYFLFFSNFFKYLYYFKYYFLIIILFLISATYFLGYTYNKNLDKIVESKITIIPPSALMKYELDLPPSIKKIPNLSDFYMSILTNNLNFNEFLNKYSYEKKALKLKVTFKVPLFDEIQGINTKPTQPRIFISLIVNTKYFQNFNAQSINILNKNFNNYYENIFNNSLNDFFIQQLNESQFILDNNLTAMMNVRSKLAEFETINDKQQLTDQFILFFLKKEISNLKNELSYGKNLILEISKKKYSHIFGQKYLSTKDVTNYVSYYIVLPIIIIMIFFFISIFMFFINFSFLFKLKK